MIAYTKPKKVEWFEYTGDTPEFREWCKSVGIIVKQQGEDLNIRPPDPNYPEDHRCYSPITLYRHLGDCVIVIGDNYFSRMPKEHFLKHYDIPMDVSWNLESLYPPEIYTKKYWEDIIKEMKEYSNKDPLDDTSKKE